MINWSLIIIYLKMDIIDFFKKVLYKMYLTKIYCLAVWEMWKKEEVAQSNSWIKLSLSHSFFKAKFLDLTKINLSISNTTNIS